MIRNVFDVPRGRRGFGASAPHHRHRSPMDLVGHQAIGHSAEAKQCPIVCCCGRHSGPTPPPPPFRVDQVRRLRGRGVLAAVAAWAVAGSRWPCWWWVVRGCRWCCVWCGRRRGPTSCVPARVWMARGATPQAHVFIYGLECVLWVCFFLRYSSRPFG